MISLTDALIFTGIIVWLFWGLVFTIYAMRTLDTYLYRSKIQRQQRREKQMTPGLNLQETFEKQRRN